MNGLRISVISVKKETNVLGGSGQISAYKGYWSGTSDISDVLSEKYLCIINRICRLGCRGFYEFLGMEESDDVLGLQDYIKNVDHSSLPRILQVCSGVYFQGKKAVDNALLY